MDFRCDDAYFGILIDLLLYLTLIGTVVCDEFGFGMFFTFRMTVGLLRMDWNEIILQNYGDLLSENMLAERIQIQGAY